MQKLDGTRIEKTGGVEHNLLKGTSVITGKGT